MKFILIAGPPASGKMTVANHLCQLTGLSLFHNHMSIELVHQFFEFGTKSFRRLDDLIRFGVFEEVAKSDLPGLVFTLVWAFDDKSDHEYVEKAFEIFREEGAAIHVVELICSLEERLQRNRHPDRLAAKPTKRDVDHSEAMLLKHEQKYRMNSREKEFPEYEILRIDNTVLTPEQVANQIIDHYQL